jgi:hypothetical protein
VAEYLVKKASQQPLFLPENSHQKETIKTGQLSDPG